MYEPIPPRTTERLVHYGSQFVIHATVALCRAFWRMDHVLRWITLPFLIFAVEFVSQRLGGRRAHRPPAATAIEVLLVLFVMAATAFGGPRKR